MQNTERDLAAAKTWRAAIFSGASASAFAAVIAGLISATAYAQDKVPSNKLPEITWAKSATYYLVDDEDGAATFLLLKDDIPRGPIQVATLIHLTRNPPRSGETRTYDVDCTRSLMSPIYSSKIMAGGPLGEVFQGGPQVDLNSGPMEKLIKSLVCIPSTELDDDLLIEGSLADFAKEFWK